MAYSPGKRFMLIDAVPLFTDTGGREMVGFDVTNVDQWMEQEQERRRLPRGGVNGWAANLPYPVTLLEYSHRVLRSAFGETESQPSREGILAVEHPTANEILITPCPILWDGTTLAMLSDLELARGTIRVETSRGRIETLTPTDDDPKEGWERDAMLTLWTIQFCNASRKITDHQSVVNVETPAPINRKRRKQGKPEYSSYKVLNLPGIPKPQVRYQTDAQFVAELPEHLVRCHLQTGTNEAPLFGQPWGVGVFVVPVHKRGNRTNGIAKKDYSVAAGNNERGPEA